MTSKIRYAIAVLALALFLIRPPFPLTHAQGISQLQQFTATTSPERAITQSVFGKAFRLTGQGSGCAQFSANGTLTSTGSDCGTGSGGNSFGKAWEIISGFLTPTTTVAVKIDGTTTLATTTATELSITSVSNPHTAFTVSTAAGAGASPLTQPLSKLLASDSAYDQWLLDVENYGTMTSIEVNDRTQKNYHENGLSVTSPGPQLASIIQQGYVNFRLQDDTSTADLLELNSFSTGDSLLVEQNNDGKAIHTLKDFFNQNQSQSSVFVDDYSRVSDGNTYTKSGSTVFIRNRVQKTLGDIINSAIVLDVRNEDASSTGIVNNFRGEGTGDTAFIDTNNNARAINIDKDVTNAASTGETVKIVNTSNVSDGSTHLKGGRMVQVTNDVSTTSGSITDTGITMAIEQKNASSSGHVLYLNNYGSGDGLNIDQRGTGNGLTINQLASAGTSVSTQGALFVSNTLNPGYGINIYSNLDTASAPLLNVLANNAAFNQYAFQTTNNGTQGNFINQVGALAADRAGLRVFSNTTHTGTNASLFQVYDQGVSNTKPAALIRKFANGLALDLSHTPTNTNFSNGAFRLTATAAVTDGNTYTKSGTIASFSSGVTLTSGSITDTAKVLTVTQNNAAATGNVFEVANSGTGNSFVTDTSKLIVKSSGNVGIGTTTPYAKLSVVGTVVAANFVGTTTATSTLGGGVNIATGCYAISGTCLSAGGGSGDVVGPASATDNALARFDSTTGKLIQNSGVTVDDTGNMLFPNATYLKLGNGVYEGQIHSSNSTIGLDGVIIRNKDNTKYGALTLSGLFSAYHLTTQNGGGFLNNDMSSYRTLMNKGDLGTIITASGGQYSWANATGFSTSPTVDTGLARNSAGVVRVTDGSTGTGSLLASTIGIGTTSPFSALHVTSGASATTTVTIGSIGLTSSKGCVNMNAADGSAASFYISAAHTMVVEPNYCR